MSRGIDPDLLVVRADRAINKEIISKLSVMCGLPEPYVIPSATVQSIYEVPVNYHHYGIGQRISEKLQLPDRQFDLSTREMLGNHIQHSTTDKKIALIGKYCSLEDAYYSLNEGLKTA